MDYHDQSLVLRQEWAEGYDDSLPGTRKERRELHYGDRVFATGVRVVSAGLVLLLGLIALFLCIRAWPALQTYSWRFIYTSTWDPVREVYGALPVIFGTIVSSLLAMAIATP